LSSSFFGKARKLYDLFFISQASAAFVYFTVFLILPISMILVAAKEYGLSSLVQPHNIRLSPIGNLVTITKVGESLNIRFYGYSFGTILNSLIIASIVTLFSTILGVLVAFVLARYDFPLKSVLRILAIIPLLMTPFVNAYVIKKLFGPTFGYNTISWLLSTVIGHDVKLMFAGYSGVVLTQIITFYPIVYLNVYSSMNNIDPSLEEQAENLGAKGFRLFRTITLPLSLPGVMAGATLVFIFSIEDVAAPIIFGVRDVLAYQVYSYFQGVRVGLGNPEAAGLSLVMLVIALAMFIAIRNYVNLRQYAMLSKGGRWKPRIRKLGLKGLVAIYLFVFPLVLFTVSPQIGVFMLALSERWAETPLPQGFTLKHLMGLFQIRGVFKAILNSVLYSLAAVAIIVVLAISTSYVVSRYKLRGISVLDYLSTAPLAIPGLVIAYGYFYFFHDAFLGTMLDPIVNPALPIIIAYSIRRLPFAARSIFAGLQQTHVSLEEASLNLGASRLRTLTKIVIPLIILNIVSGAMISFVYCVAETSVSITLGGLGGDITSPTHKAPISMAMLDLITSGRVESVHLAAALGVFLILVQIIVIVLITLVFKQSYAFIGV
jgi:ABC-type Fe3+ transport system permease subunit